MDRGFLLRKGPWFFVEEGNEFCAEVKILEGPRFGKYLNKYPIVLHSCV